MTNTSEQIMTEDTKEKEESLFFMTLRFAVMNIGIGNGCKWIENGEPIAGTSLIFGTLAALTGTAIAGQVLFNYKNPIWEVPMFAGFAFGGEYLSMRGTALEAPLAVATTVSGVIATKYLMQDFRTDERNNLLSLKHSFSLEDLKVGLVSKIISDKENSTYTIKTEKRNLLRSNVVTLDERRIKLESRIKDKFGNAIITSTAKSGGEISLTVKTDSALDKALAHATIQKATRLGGR